MEEFASRHSNNYRLIPRRKIIKNQVVNTPFKSRKRVL